MHHCRIAILGVDGIDEEGFALTRPPVDQYDVAASSLDGSMPHLVQCTRYEFHEERCLLECSVMMFATPPFL